MSKTLIDLIRELAQAQRAYSHAVIHFPIGSREECQALNRLEDAVRKVELLAIYAEAGGKVCTT